MEICSRIILFPPTGASGSRCSRHLQWHSGALGTHADTDLVRLALCLFCFLFGCILDKSRRRPDTETVVAVGRLLSHHPSERRKRTARLSVGLDGFHTPECSSSAVDLGLVPPVMFFCVFSGHSVISTNGSCGAQNMERIAVSSWRQTGAFEVVDFTVDRPQERSKWWHT